MVMCCIIENGRECPKQFKTLFEIYTHFRSKHSKKNDIDRKKCNWKNCCDKIKKGLYESHMIFHLYHNYLKCKGQTYLSNKTILNSKICKNNNIYRVANVNRWYHCEWLNCTNIFGNIIDFVDHVNKYHANNCHSAFCLWNGCNSKKKMNVYKHINTHTNYKLVACPYCGYMFATNQRLESHLSSIDAIKTFNCDMCYKFYSTYQHLIRHKKLKHSDKRIFACNKTYLNTTKYLKYESIQ
ncbi:hypothetical protein A3Q56_05934 [Intoshia linei]|uniref:C2H2-type domain-containing protein n=1 Tax=Intoshia linei TaxID=1819745 RepID=A0A177AYT6_9BILA|nr:hypothetical protein A3Q56_05934 [Intoshia linei]